jgi:hypothetical protein
VPNGRLRDVARDLIVYCREGVMLCAKATVQQNNETEAVALKSCGMFEPVARLCLMTREINRILHLFRSITHAKLNDAGMRDGCAN